jgi:mRNA interferase HigB
MSPLGKGDIFCLTLDIIVLIMRTCSGSVMHRPMRLIKRCNVLKDAECFPKEIQKEVKAWCDVVKTVKWNHLDDVRRNYKRSVDLVDEFTVFNIKDYRLIVSINYRTKIIYYRFLLTHKEYDTGKWKYAD